MNPDTSCVYQPPLCFDPSSPRGRDCDAALRCACTQRRVPGASGALGPRTAARLAEASEAQRRCERRGGRQRCVWLTRPFRSPSHVRPGEQGRREFQRVRRRVEVHHGLAEHLPHLRPRQLGLHRQERAEAGADWIRWASTRGRFALRVALAVRGGRRRGGRAVSASRRVVCTCKRHLAECALPRLRQEFGIGESVESGKCDGKSNYTELNKHEWRENIEERIFFHAVTAFKPCNYLGHFSPDYLYIYYTFCYFHISYCQKLISAKRKAQTKPLFSIRQKHQALGLFLNVNTKSPFWVWLQMQVSG